MKLKLLISLLLLATLPAYALTNNQDVIKANGLILKNDLAGSVTVLVTNGGSGVKTFAAHGTLVGAGTSPLVVVGPGTTNQLFTAMGVGIDPIWKTWTFLVPSDTNNFGNVYTSKNNTYTGTFTNLYPNTTKIIVGDDLADANSIIQVSKTVTAGSKSWYFSSDDGIGAVSSIYGTPKHFNITGPAFRYYSQAGNPQIVTTNTTGTTIYDYAGNAVLVSGPTLFTATLANMASITTSNLVVHSPATGAGIAGLTNGFLTSLGAAALTNVFNTFTMGQSIVLTNASGSNVGFSVDTAGNTGSIVTFKKGGAIKSNINQLGEFVLSNNTYGNGYIFLYGQVIGEVAQTDGTAGRSLALECYGASNNVTINPGGNPSGNAIKRVTISNVSGVTFNTNAGACGILSFYTTNVAVTVPLVAANAEFETNIVLTGAVAGSLATPRASVYTTGIEFQVFCTNANTLTMIWKNNTTAGVTPAAGNYGGGIINSYPQ